MRAPACVLRSSQVIKKGIGKITALVQTGLTKAIDLLKKNLKAFSDTAMGALTAALKTVVHMRMHVACACECTCIRTGVMHAPAHVRCAGIGHAEGDAGVSLETHRAGMVVKARL